MKKDVKYYLENPSRLSEITSDQILKRIEKQPYYQPLHLLLSIKNKQEGIHGSEINFGAYFVNDYEYNTPKASRTKTKKEETIVLTSKTPKAKEIVTAIPLAATSIINVVTPQEVKIEQEVKVIPEVAKQKVEQVQEVVAIEELAIIEKEIFHESGDDLKEDLIEDEISEVKIIEILETEPELLITDVSIDIEDTKIKLDVDLTEDMDFSVEDIVIATSLKKIVKEDKPLLVIKNIKPNRVNLSGIKTGFIIKIDEAEVKFDDVLESTVNSKVKKNKVKELEKATKKKRKKNKKKVKGEKKSKRKSKEKNKRKGKKKKEHQVKVVYVETAVNQLTENNDIEGVSSFSNWLLDKEPINDKPVKMKDKKKKSKKSKKKKNKVLKIAKDSIKKSEMLISEPLAGILANQGHKKKAKKMYKQLSLIFPEKSSYFAAQIEKLKKI
ncbi:MAG: hypothetical protein V3V14_02210 [Saprospiraceae bacterium]